ncbi:Condensin complex subunit 2, partial [Linum perenne]
PLSCSRKNSKSQIGGRKKKSNGAFFFFFFFIFVDLQFQKADSTFCKHMAEILSPNPTMKQRLPRIQSPKSPFVLGSNNDQLERAQARAARAAAVRRKAAAAVNSQHAGGESADPSCLDKQQIFDLFHNCIKLASENKINQKNTWDLNLIDHLYDIIKVEEEDTETNFQKASCTLEAGVRIYSLRVDSVHSEAYKVLGGIHRVGHDNEQDADSGDTNADTGEQEDGQGKKDTEKRISPLSTLEPSFEALNVKKLDVAFAVDPLYHQTSAQFDEGGAKGLLLNNLGVYGGCRVLFDSQEVPGKCFTSENQCGRNESVDLSFAKDCIEQMLVNMQAKDEISPTLNEIISRFDEHNKRPLDTFSSHQNTGSQEELHNSYDNEPEFVDDAFENQETWAVEQDDCHSVVDEDMDNGDASIPSYHQVPKSKHRDMDDRTDTIDTYLLRSLGFASKHNAWAGPDHWKYQKIKGPENNIPNGAEGPEITTKKPKTKKQAEPDIDFTKALDEEVLNVFAPPKNPKSLLLPANRTTSYYTKLPEDCHYQPEDLVKLFLLPNVMCIQKRGRRSREESGQQFDDYEEAQPSWDDDGDDAFGGQFEDINMQSDVDNPNALVSQPRQVAKIEVNYDKRSKQVDVQRLKETLWRHIQESPETSVQEEEAAVSFKGLLASFPSECNAAASINDISPHLCFICLLHLANEHGLSIRGRSSLDDLEIHLPSELV